MKSKKKLKNGAIKGFFSALVGFICGFFGGGGGLVCVPVLERVYKLPSKQAHATAIMVIFPLSVISSVVYVINNNFNLLITLSACIGVLIGGFVGAIFLKKLKSNIIEWLFIAILFTAGVRMMI